MQNFISIMWVVLANTQFTTASERTISGVHISPGRAETLVRRGGITNHHLIACCLNISAIYQHISQNYPNQLICVEVTVCSISVVFLRHNVYALTPACETNRAEMHKAVYHIRSNQVICIIFLLDSQCYRQVAQLSQRDRATP